jgi:hypothetical protein
MLGSLYAKIAQEATDPGLFDRTLASLTEAVSETDDTAFAAAIEGFFKKMGKGFDKYFTPAQIGQLHKLVERRMASVADDTALGSVIEAAHASPFGQTLPSVVMSTPGADEKAYAAAERAYQGMMRQPLMSADEMKAALEGAEESEVATLLWSPAFKQSFAKMNPQHRYEMGRYVTQLVGGIKDEEAKASASQAAGTQLGVKELDPSQQTPMDQFGKMFSGLLGGLGIGAQPTTPEQQKQKEELEAKYLAQAGKVAPRPTIKPTTPETPEADVMAEAAKAAPTEAPPVEGLKAPENVFVNARDRFGTSYGIDKSGRVWRYYQDPDSGKAQYIRMPQLDEKRYSEKELAKHRQELESWHLQEFQKRGYYQDLLKSQNHQKIRQAYERAQRDAKRFADLSIDKLKRNEAATGIGLHKTDYARTAAKSLGAEQVYFDQGGWPYVMDPATNKPRRITTTEMWRAQNPEEAKQYDERKARRERQLSDPKYMAHLVRTYKASNTPLPANLRGRLRADPAFASQVAQEAGRIEADRLRGAELVQQRKGAPPTDPNIRAQVISERKRKQMGPLPWMTESEWGAPVPQPAAQAPTPQVPAAPRLGQLHRQYTTDQAATYNKRQQGPMSLGARYRAYKPQGLA